jgi:hypothetical protein
MPAKKNLNSAKPRNTVFLKLKQRLLSGGGAGRHREQRAFKRDEDKDLADRIREVGEW